jgi:hypothetical protein
VAVCLAWPPLHELCPRTHLLLLLLLPAGVCCAGLQAPWVVHGATGGSTTAAAGTADTC